MTDQETKKLIEETVARVAALSNRVKALEEAMASRGQIYVLSNRVETLEEEVAYLYDTTGGPRSNALSNREDDPCPKCEEVASLKRQLAQRHGGD